MVTGEQRKGPLARRILFAVAVGWLLVVLQGFALAGCGPSAPPPPAPGAAGTRDAPGIYAQYCAGCHGPDGKRGNEKMRLVNAAGKPDVELERVIADGRGAMPSWKGRLSAAEIAAVARYVKQFR
jgi:mono/diheme cytochrome c family protein